MKLEMDENTMYSKVWRSIVTIIGCVFATCWALNSAVSWRETGVKVELLRMQVTPEGMRYAELARDKAMFESVTRTKP